MGRKTIKKEADEARGENPANMLISAVNKPTTRREFLKIAGAGGAGIMVLGLAGCINKEGATQAIQSGPGYSPDAQMMVLQEPSRCVGCRRCEVACTAIHDNKVQPGIARVKISRNFNFGPDGPRLGAERGPGLFGNFRLIGETCLQCQHPVPCITACPNGAIEVVPPINARIINTSKCKGCKTCLKACSWAMTSFDEETQKATKCDLCGGDPQCVKICPSGALTYVPWRDRSRDTPVRQAVPAYITLPSGTAQTCDDCHTVGTGIK